MSGTDARVVEESEVDEAAALAALPMALLALDGTGNILYANPRAGRLLDPDGDGSGVGSLVGRNVVEFIHPEDQAFAAELLEFGVVVSDQLMGPITMRYRTVEGEVRYTEAWSENHLDSPGLGAYLLVVTEESVRHRLSEAITGVAGGMEFADVVDTVTRAMVCHPMNGPAAVLELLEDSSIMVHSQSGFPGPEIPGCAGWWSTAFQVELGGGDTGHRRLADMNPEISSSTGGAPGMRVAWVRRIPTPDRELRLLCWHHSEGAPSPNQAQQMSQAAGILGLSLTQEAQRRQLEYLAYHDPLTGLHNRAYLYERLPVRQPAGTSVLYLDLDDFKEVNDRHGHEVGDHLLIRVGEVLRGAVRDTDTVVRLGGDEFVVVCPSAAEPARLRALADRLIGEISAIDEVSGRTVRIGASVGIVHHRGSRDLDELLRRADSALYAAKFEGRGEWRMAALR